jgi:imidazolonepropionase-like amidohydrolase
MKKLLIVVMAIAVMTGVAMAMSPSANLGKEKVAKQQTLFTNIKVFNGIDDKLIAQDVLVEGNLIMKMGKGLKAGKGAIVIDGGGHVLMPGIIEAHNHLSLPISPEEIFNDKDWFYVGAAGAEEARRYLMRGWTTVRDIGGPTQDLKRAIDDGVVLGPRIYTSGPIISQTSGHGDFRDSNDPNPNMVTEKSFWYQKCVFIADGPDEVTRAVRESLRLGAVQIKMMAGGGVSSKYDPLDAVQYSLEEFRAGVKAAENWNTYVAVHAYTDRSIQIAIEAGVKVIEHGQLMTEETAKLMAEKGIWLSTQAQVLNVPEEQLAFLSSVSMKKYRRVKEGLDNQMKYAKKHGLKVAFGTDLFGTRQNFNDTVKEFSARLQWFTPVEILRQATSGNAELLELTGPLNPYQDGPLGVIKEGAYADLLIVDGNPLKDIRVLEDTENNIRIIMKDGVIYKNTL